MQTTPLPESNHVIGTLALRGVACLVAPMLFLAAFIVALASLPAAALRWGR